MPPDAPERTLDVGLAVTHATVVTAGPAGVLHDTLLLVDDGRFVHVGPMADAPAYRARHTLDARGALVVAGLVNTHSHLYQSLLCGLPAPRRLDGWLAQVVFPALRRLTPEVYETAATLAALEALHSGVTTVVDYTVDHADPAIYTAALAGARRAGVRLHLARGLAGRGRPGTPATPTAEALAHTRALADEADEPVWLALPPVPAMSEETLAAAAAFVADTGTPVTAHLAETPDDDAWCRREHGETCVQRLDRHGLVGPRLLAVHGVHLTTDDVATLGAAGASVSYNPVSNRYLCARDAPVAELTAHGVRVALGTDGAASNGTQDMFQVMKWAALGPGAPDDTVAAAGWALAMATREAATALHTPDRGAIAPGCSADFVVYRPDRLPGPAPAGEPTATLVYSGSPAGVDCVVVRGEIVLRDGVSTRVDERELKAAAVRAAAHLTDQSTTVEARC